MSEPRLWLVGKSLHWETVVLAADVREAYSVAKAYDEVDPCMAGDIDIGTPEEITSERDIPRDWRNAVPDSADTGPAAPERTCEAWLAWIAEAPARALAAREAEASAAGLRLPDPATSDLFSAT